MAERVLGDLGERRIVRELLGRWVTGLGDDCAAVSVGDVTVLLTTDPVPQPAAKVLGGDPDLYWMGWLLVIINASDLAAAGAKPLAFLAAIEAPASLSIEDFGRFMQGISDACSAEDLAYVGGNLREGREVSAVGTALGVCRSGRSLSRAGARPGDVLASVGQGGVFWRDALLLEDGVAVPCRNTSPLFRPRSRVPAMRALAEARLVSAAMDNSDGLLASLAQLSDRSGLGIELDLNALTVPGDVPAVDPARLWLGWGDWNVLVCVPPGRWGEALQVCEATGTPLIRIGEVSESAGPVVLRRGDVTRPAPRLESERFTADSWFETGVKAYVSMLKELPLPPP